MSNSISDLKTAGAANSSAKLDGIQFNKIQKTGYNSTAKYVLKNTPWYTLDTTTPLKPAVNAVDIDWNEAVIPYGNLENGDSVTVNSTGELLSLISKMQQEVYYTIESVNSSPKNFYNDLVSNKKVYIDDNPVFYYKISGDTNAKTIVAYTFADHMGIPYAVKYNIPITITSGSTDDTWECGPITGGDLLDYFSPIVLIHINTDSSSTILDSVKISVGNKVINIQQIDALVTYFLQSCDIFAYIDTDENIYWRLEGRNIESVNSSTSGSITRYMYRINYNQRFTVTISWNYGGNFGSSITVKATLMN